jgi:cobalt-zinc-cadmium efflux system outer membrane protein
MEGIVSRVIVPSIAAWPAMRTSPTSTALVAALAGCALMLGCAATGDYQGPERVSAELQNRTGHSFAACPAAGECASVDRPWPPGVELADGLSEDEAITLALWNNARYQELLAELGITWADLVIAGQLANPELSMFFPVGPKEWEWTLAVPLDALLKRPRRVAAAESESRRVAQQLIQEGLNLVRDVRVAYADWLLAADRLDLARESSAQRADLLRRASAAQKAGEVSPLDVSAANIYHLRGEDESGRAALEWQLTTQRLQMLIGIQDICSSVRPAAGDLLPLLHAPCDCCELVSRAVAARPDVLAADEALNAAGERARLARFDAMTFRGAIDYNDDGDKGEEAGPGLDVTLPVFHQNQGQVARAEAEWEQLRRRARTVRDNAALEVNQSAARFVQAQQAFQLLSQRIVPPARAAYQSALRAYFERGASLPHLLELSRQVDESQLRRAETIAELRRAAAELERSVGHRVLSLPSPCDPAVAARHSHFFR